MLTGEGVARNVKYCQVFFELNFSPRIITVLVTVSWHTLVLWHSSWSVTPLCKNSEPCVCDGHVCVGRDEPKKASE